MLRKFFTTSALGIAVLLALTPTGEARILSPRETEAAVAQAIGAAFGAQPVRVQPNAASSMPACSTPLHVDVLPGEMTSYRSVGVKCSSPAWTIYTGVMIQSKVRVAITRRAILPGATITPEDVVWADVPAQDIEGVGAKVLPGETRAVSSIPPGQILTKTLVNTPAVIHGGDHVTVIVVDHGVTIQTSGVALQDGGFGQEIEVKVVATGHELEGAISRRPGSKSGVYVQPK